MFLSKRKVLQLLFSVPESNSINYVVSHILEQLNLKLSDVDASKINVLKKAIGTLRSKRNIKWKLAKRVNDRFELQNKKWLDSEFCVAYLNSDTQSQTPQRQCSGRPSIEFNQKSNRSKRREAAQISNKNQNNPISLLMACRYAARLTGEKDLSAVLNELCKDSKKVAHLIQNVGNTTSIVKMTSEEALGYLLDHNMSKRDYQSMRLLVKSRNADIFPSYNDILAAKSKCRPNPQFVKISETSAEVLLQGLLDHTTERILQLQDKPILQFIEQNRKVLNAITGTKSTQTCSMCKAKPTEFNNLSNTFIPDPKSLQYGLSPLHSWIRLFECSLHLSYRLHIKVWQVRTSEHKIALAERKKEIQNILWERLGLIVDKPKTGGSGNTNDGNTARRAFAKPDELAEYLGLDKQLMRNFKTILIALSCHLPIDPSRFDALCKSTASIFINAYPWFNMPASVHKILMHGADVIRNTVLPIGMMGEEASEARNKDYRKFRADRSRKHNRIVNMEDVFYRLMDTSDPLISNINLDTRIHNVAKTLLPQEVRNLLMIPEEVKSDIDSDPDSSDDVDATELAEFENLLNEVELSDEEE
ncbi:PREDICTED: uncharacterized protein LOC105556321 [Vollenhovia emeryi]|uniref:uncharacterized protein LOC105556321 n=1 Tax=Vollenhovia emeryi TaxID=411798 RepID=UPI0005F5276A|nr:PREDICTED: uncharacterized protein LOC105556321 [Vollenhovia emeryi]